MQSKKEREVLAERLDHHVEEEGKILAEYRALSEKLGEGSVGFLVNLILTEEELHHLLLRTMAKWLREPPGEKDSIDVLKANRRELLEYTRRLKKHEEETINGCRDLGSELLSKDEDLLCSLLDAMVLDSEKHHRLLGVVEKMLKA